MSAPSIPSSLRQLVFERAQGKCEYCFIHQDVSIYSHEVDHIIALKHGGQTIAENLALSCLPCNRHKGSDLATFDPISNEIAPLFNPPFRIKRYSYCRHYPNGSSHGLSADAKCADSPATASSVDRSETLSVMRT